MRADAAPHIGSGHLTRCLTLAMALRDFGARVLFVGRRHTGETAYRAVERAGVDCHLLPPPEPVADLSDNAAPHASWLGVDPEMDAEQTLAAWDEFNGQPADWAVVDHYGIDAAWERRMRHGARRILAMDDLADRKHDCDLLLDPLPHRAAENYERLVPRHCRLMLGPGHALLRTEFPALRKAALARRKRDRVTRVLLAMGGYDPDDLTTRALVELDDVLAPDVQVDVVLAGGAPHRERVARLCRERPYQARLSVDVPDMARRMCEADIAIGASGMTAWERCCLGLPSVVVTFADNQLPFARALASAGAACYVGNEAEVHGHPGHIGRAVADLIADPPQRHAMSRRAAALVDGHGVDRVVHALQEA